MFITLESPSQATEKEAVSAGFYQSPGWGKDYPKLQILIIADLLNGEEVKMPPTMTTFRQAGKAERDKPVQATLPGT